MASVPLSVLVPDQNQPLGLAEGVTGIQGNQQAMQLRNLLAPGQLQQQQQELQQGQQAIQTGAIDLQMKQIGLKNAQTVQAALSDPKFTDYLNRGQTGSDSPASSPSPNGSSVPLHPIAQVLASKYGLPLLGQNGALDISQQFTKSAQEQATLLKTQGDTAQTNLKTAADQLSNFDNLVEPVLAEKDPAKQQQGIANVQAEIRQNPQLYPADATQHLNSLGTMQGLQGAANTSKVRQMLIEDVTRQSGAQSAAAEATQKTAAAAAPTAEQLTNARNTLATYSAIPPNMRAGLDAEMKAAPDWETLQKVQARADASQQANQLHQDTLANTRAIMGNKFGEAGLTANEKIWTDPQRGYAGALAQANQTKASIVAGADGNGLLTNLVPTMEVLGVNHAAGINRISPQEAIAAGTNPEWATKWNAWATKAATGKLTSEMAAQGRQLMDIVTDAAYNRAIQSSQLIARGHQLTPDQVPAMNRDGSLTTLDKVSSGTSSGPKSSAGPAAGMTRIKASDGTLYDLPTQNLFKARRRDPGLQVVQ